MRTGTTGILNKQVQAANRVDNNRVVNDARFLYFV